MNFLKSVTFFLSLLIIYSTNVIVLELNCDSNVLKDQSTFSTTFSFKDQSIFETGGYCRFNQGADLILDPIDKNLRGVLQDSFVLEFQIRIQKAQEIEIFRFGDFSIIFRATGNALTGSFNPCFTIKDKTRCPYGKTFLQSFVTYKIMVEVLADKTSIIVYDTAGSTPVTDFTLDITEFSRDGQLFIGNSTNEGFDLQYFQIYPKYDLGCDSDELKYCNWNGECVNDVCQCNEGYDGIDCGLFKCGSIWNNETHVCSGKGVCSDIDICYCDDGYTGIDCSDWLCGDYENTDNINVCNGFGECIKPNTCNCQDGYIGYDCQEKVSDDDSSLFLAIGITSILIFVIIVVLSVVIVPILFFLIFKVLKYSKLKDIDLLLAEQKVTKNEMKEIAKVNVNKTNFDIDISEIKIIKQIGSGASNSNVYLVDFHNTKCAYKVFITELYGETNQFAEFEKEVEFMASIKFQYILNYLGATVKPPRVGILMEFCQNGDLEEYLKKNTNVSMDQRIEWILQISKSMAFLHSKQVLHRDLKSKNVLVTSSMETRLIDFGLSTFFSSDDKTKTKRIGTSYYMAPEVINGKYGKKADVYSASILFYEIITGNFKPFGDNISYFRIEEKVLQDKNFKPKLNSPQFEKIEWMKPILMDCWDHEPKKRMNFSKIIETIQKHHKK